MVNKLRNTKLSFIILIVFVLTSCQSNNQQATVNTSTTQQSQTKTSTTQQNQTETSTQSSTVEDTKTEVEKDIGSTEDYVYYGLNINELEKLANQGDAKAQFTLGLMYDSGNGISKDDEKAVEWYSKAVEQGYYYAQHNLGIKYYYGTGIDKDYQKAFELLSKAAEQGNDVSQFAVGLMYYEGNGTEKDYKKAFEMFSKSSEQANTDAQYMLGLLYYYGQGTDPDYQKSLELFRKAAEQGSEDAKKVLESINSTQLQTQAQVTNETTSEGSGNLGDYYLEIIDYEIKKDYEDKDSIDITYKFTNNSEENATFFVSILAKAFQDGVELSITSISGEERNNYKEIKTGASIEVKQAYILSNLESPGEIEAKSTRYSDKGKVIKTFEIAQTTE